MSQFADKKTSIALTMTAVGEAETSSSKLVALDHGQTVREF